MSQEFIDSLRRDINNEWKKIKAGRFWRRVMGEPVTPALYKALMLEIFHYTKHNSRNQAAAAYVEAPDGLLAFAYKHAAEELGHEKMVLRDLESLSMLEPGDQDAIPMAPTEALIGYLYFVSLRYGALARLGYSFWAEDVYDQIGEALAKIRSDMKLNDKNMTFFVAHATIDEKHIEQVTDCILRYAETPDQQAQVRRVALTTLFLTGQLMDAVADSEK
jgi:hypothetical protein